MTPARKRALQWFHDRGEVQDMWSIEGHPSSRMVIFMIIDGQLDWRESGGHFLTDKGRRMLHGDAK